LTHAIEDSESGFTSKQRKKVIYGRVKRGKRRNNRVDNRKVKERKIDSSAGWSFYTPVRATQARQVEG